MSTTAQTAPVEAISLYTVQDENGQVDSAVPVRWCISRETAEKLQREKIENPHLLLVISNNGVEISRYVVPLFNEMHYVQFLRPGDNLIHATIVWYGSAKELRKTLTERFKDSDRYRVTLIEERQPRTLALGHRIKRYREQYYATNDEDQETRLRALIDQLQAELDELERTEPKTASLMSDFGSDAKRLDYEAKLGVVVPQEMFAKQPPAWMKWLSELYPFWERAPRDQCILRRRALVTGVTLPLAVMLGVVVLALWAVLTLTIEVFNLIAVGVLLLFGLRNIKFEPLLHPYDPFDYPPRNIWSRIRPSVWWNKKVEYDDGDYVDYVDRHPAFFAVNPPVIVAFALIGLALKLAFGLYASMALVVAEFALVPLALGLIVLISAFLARGPLSRYNERRAKEREAELKATRKRYREQLDRERELLACSSASREVSVSALPKGHRTVRLRFQDLKSQVCRPFAK